jgi:VIT1/CCC1 family predicted Fe2+/Mn2+ transporter
MSVTRARARVGCARPGVVSLLCLGVLGALGAHLGGAPKGKAAVRVVVGGALAMSISAGVGRLVGMAV